MMMMMMMMMMDDDVGRFQEQDRWWRYSVTSSVTHHYHPIISG